jgi:tRNA threonylcarbamoyladenosine biosynthesis protein TsaB
MESGFSIAIETSCRMGGVAIGRDDQLLEVDDFDASARHATQLLARLDAMLARHGVRPSQIAEAYISAGPGGFTGLRIGITVGRTLGQLLPRLRLVAVPTAQAVAENAAGLDWQHLAVVMDSKNDQVYAALFERRSGEIVSSGPPGTATIDEVLAAAPRPLLVTGEALGYVKASGPGVSVADAAIHMPTASGVWRVGRRLALHRQFVEYAHLLPIYSRKPEAVRLWEKRQDPK